LGKARSRRAGVVSDSYQDAGPIEDERKLQSSLEGFYAELDRLAAAG
jgi:hypothetical protein